MKKGITNYWGFPIPIKKRIEIIKQAGFDCVMISLDSKFNKQNGTIGKQVKLIKRAGLSLTSAHSSYTTNLLPNFWLDNKIGDKITKQNIKELKLCKKYGCTCLVLHVVGNPSEIGLKRLQKILTYCEKYNVPIAIENLENNKLLEYIFSNITNDYLKFCYDSGHHNFIDRDYDYFPRYQDKLVCLHLHDNMGNADDHTVWQFGTIDWDKEAKKLANCNEVNLDFELLNHIKRPEISCEQYVKMCFDNATKLDKLIELYKKTNLS